MEECSNCFFIHSHLQPSRYHPLNVLYGSGFSKLVFYPMLLHLQMKACNVSGKFIWSQKMNGICLHYFHRSRVHSHF